MTLMVQVLLAINAVGATWLTYRAFESYPNHSPESVMRWIGLYLLAVVGPTLWSIYYQRKYRAVFDAHGKLRDLGFLPITFGTATLLVALNLISGAR